jgi:hypothetical protein
MLRAEQRDKLLTAATILALVGWYIRPGNRTADVLKAIGESHAGMIRAATSGKMGTAMQEAVTNAESFAEEARSAVEEFWSGFAE